MAGGSGTRLWPLSRAGYPKQFLVLSRQHTACSSRPRCGCRRWPATTSRWPRRWSSATRSTASWCSTSCARSTPQPAAVLLEPMGRNTAPALTLAALQALRRRRRPGAGGDAGRPDRDRRRRLHRRAAARRARPRPTAPSSSWASRPTGPRPATATSAPRPAAAAMTVAQLRREARPGHRRALPGRRRLLLEQRHVRAARLGVAGGAGALPPRHRWPPTRAAWAARSTDAELRAPRQGRVRRRARRVGRLRGDGAVPRQRLRHPHGAAGRRLVRPGRLGSRVAGGRQGRRRATPASATRSSATAATRWCTPPAGWSAWSGWTTWSWSRRPTPCWWPTASAARTSRRSSASSAREQRGEQALHRKVHRPWGWYDSIDHGPALPGQAHHGQARRLA